MQTGELMFRPDVLLGQRILVTGGGSGLGKVIAEACAMFGATVYICGRRGTLLQQTADDLMERHGGRIVPIACDIREPQSIQAMLDSIWADGGALTGLVNNAAGNFISRTEDLSPRAFDAIANIVFRGSFLVTLDCGKRWLSEGRAASVVSILTTWAWTGSPFVVPSAMSKAGLNAMTQSLAVEWGHRGVRLNAIAPGPFPTEGMAKRLAPGTGADGLLATPFSRLGCMTEFANLAIFLLAPGAEFVNGQTIAIDGAELQASGGTLAKLREWGEGQWQQARESIKDQNSSDRARQTV